MDDTTSDTLGQADEDILTHPVSDDALAAAAGTAFPGCPSEAMLTVVRCAALVIAVGLIFALETVPAARAQVTIDVSKITCDQWIGYKLTRPENIAMWLSGYYHGKP